MFYRKIPSKFENPGFCEGVFQNSVPCFAKKCCIDSTLSSEAIAFKRIFQKSFYAHRRHLPMLLGGETASIASPCPRAARTQAFGASRAASLSRSSAIELACKEMPSMEALLADAISA